MVSFKEKLEFLEGGIDFPFYNDIPKLSAVEWLLVVLSVILCVSLIFILPVPEGYLGIFMFILTVIPALYICKGNYGLFFKKAGLKDFKTIILCLIAYYLYTLIVSLFLTYLGVSLSANAVLSSFQSPDLLLIASTFIQLLAEEFFKIFILLFVMYAVYKLTDNRNLSIWVGIIATLLIFALSHASAYSNSILQILLIQGLGSIFSLYPYLKTKNVVASYILHLIVDFIPFTLIFLMTIFGMPMPI